MLIADFMFPIYINIQCSQIFINSCYHKIGATVKCSEYHHMKLISTNNPNTVKEENFVGSNFGGFKNLVGLNFCFSQTSTFLFRE